MAFDLNGIRSPYCQGSQVRLTALIRTNSQQANRGIGATYRCVIHTLRLGEAGRTGTTSGSKGRPFRREVAGLRSGRLGTTT